MRAYRVSGTEIIDGIDIEERPFPHIVIGGCREKRDVWVPVAKNDEAYLVKREKMPCPEQGKTRLPLVGLGRSTCERCGSKFVPNGISEATNGAKTATAQIHPIRGEVLVRAYIEKASVVPLRNKITGVFNGKYILTYPQNGKDSRILVFWSVSSRYDGHALIEADDYVTVLGQGCSFHRHKNMRVTLMKAEMLAVMGVGQELRASQWRNIEEEIFVLRYDGKNLTVSSINGFEEKVQEAVG